MNVYVTIFLLILLVVGTAGCIKISDVNSTQNYTGNGVTFNYPENWIVVHDNSTGIKTILAYKKSDNPYNPTQIQIQPMPNNGMSEKAIISGFRDSQTPGWTKISNNTITIDGETAYEDVYLVNDTEGYSELMRMHQIVFVKNNTTYLILLQAPDKEFDSEKPVFDMILNSFKAV